MKWRGTSEKSDEGQPASLANRLLEIKANIMQYVPESKTAVNERAVQELISSGAPQRALPVGAKAPAFTLADQNGKMLSSADLLPHRRLVIIFFRGRWCPFCVAQLEALREANDQISKAGGWLLAISPQKPLQNSFTAEQHKLLYPVLSDAGSKVARQFGVAYTMPGYQVEQFRSIFINLPHLNGDPEWQLVMPSSFIVDRDGTVLYSRCDADYTFRPEPAELIAALSR